MTTMRSGCVLVLLCATSCGDRSANLDAAREAIANAQVKIGDMVTVAEASMPGGRTLTAELRVGAPAVYAYGTIGNATLHDVRIDTVNGRIVSTLAGGTRTDGCRDSISIARAIEIAEAQIAGGVVIAAIPDDDVACAREIQVLGPDLLWEVKVSGTGQVLELEESDETED
jgi:hypothetical protein